MTHGEEYTSMKAMDETVYAGKDKERGRKDMNVTVYARKKRDKSGKGMDKS